MNKLTYLIHIFLFSPSLPPQTSSFTASPLGCFTSFLLIYVLHELSCSFMSGLMSGISYFPAPGQDSFKLYISGFKIFCWFQNEFILD